MAIELSDKEYDRLNTWVKAVLAEIIAQDDDEVSASLSKRLATINLAEWSAQDLIDEMTAIGIDDAVTIAQQTKIPLRKIMSYGWN